MKTPGFYSLVLENPAAVAKAWIPFLTPAGLWVSVRREHALGEEVVLLVQLPEGGRHSVAGQVAWIGAEHSSQGAPRKIGIALEGPEGAELAARIMDIAGTGSSLAEALLACS